MSDNFANYSNMTALITKIANKIKNAGNNFNDDDFVVENNEVSLIPTQRIFTGTQAEWDALTLTEKQTYGQANITDDEGTGKTLYANAPIGTISPFGGSNVPSGYLLCNGQAVSRTNYAELFAVIGTAFGAGDGSLTFNVPDLRGEFLRGAGTNSHADQGNGGTVGQHQDATIIPDIEAYLGDTSTPVTSIGSGTSGASAHSVNNHDSKVVVQNIWVNRVTGSKESEGTSNYDEYWAMRTVRPTNTSVNYIIKAKQVAVPADFVKSMGEFEKYSTDEVLTNKTWIDGKPIYRKVFYTDNWVDSSTYDASALNIDEVASLKAMWLREGNWFEAPYAGSSGFFSSTYYNTSSKTIIFEGNTTHAGAKNRTIIEYTKTTD